MADKYVDFSAVQTTFTEPDYTQGTLATVKELYADLDKLAKNHNLLGTDAENALNDLKAKLDALAETEHIDFEKLQEAVAKVNDLIDKAETNLDIIGAIDAIADELNAREAVVRKEVQFNSSSGKVTVDISSLGLESADDYTVVAVAGSTLADGGLNPAVIRVNKVDGKTFELLAQDTRMFFEANPLYTDAGTQADDGTFPKSFPVSIVITYNRPNFKEVIPTVDGEATIGG